MATDKNKNEVLSVEQRLKSLYELQTILSEIDRIKTIRGELPLEVKDLEDNIEGLRTRIENFHKDVEDFRKKTLVEKEKINEAQGKIARYKEQLDNVRNNREFDLLSKEVEFQTLEIELCEKHLNEYARAIDAKTNEIASTEEKLRDSEHILKEKKAELDEIVSETRHRAPHRRAHPQSIQAHSRQCSQRTRHRLHPAQRLRRMLQPHSASEADGDKDAQESNRLRILRPHHDRPRTCRRSRS